MVNNNNNNNEHMTLYILHRLLDIFAFIEKYFLPKVAIENEKKNTTIG